MNLDFMISEPAEEYHLRSRNGEYLSSHMLATFRESPIAYQKKITKQTKDVDTPAFLLGRAAHSFILEGKRAFDKEFIVSDGPVNPKTGEAFGKNTKAYAEWLASLEQTPISSKDYHFITELGNSVMKHPLAYELLAEGVAEGVVRTEYCTLPCQIRMDWFNPEKGLVDLKTCDQLKYFEHDCRKYGYIYQLAFYRAIIEAVTGVKVPVYIIAVEKNEPHSTGVWKITSEVLDQADMSNRFALARFKKCQYESHWPTDYEDLRIIESL